MAIILVSMLSGKKKAIIYTVAFLSVFTLISAGYITGLLKAESDLNETHTFLSIWVTRLVALLWLIFILIFSFTFYCEKFTEVLVSLNKKSDILKN